MKECWPSMFCKHAVHFLHTSLARDLPRSVLLFLWTRARFKKSFLAVLRGARADPMKNIWIVAIGWINGLQTILCYFLPSAFLTASATTMYMFFVMWKSLGLQTGHKKKSKTANEGLYKIPTYGHLGWVFFTVLNPCLGSCRGTTILKPCLELTNSYSKYYIQTTCYYLLYWDYIMKQVVIHPYPSNNSCC